MGRQRSQLTPAAAEDVTVLKPPTTPSPSLLPTLSASQDRAAGQNWCMSLSWLSGTSSSSVSPTSRDQTRLSGLGTGTGNLCLPIGFTAGMVGSPGVRIKGQTLLQPPQQLLCHPSSMKNSSNYVIRCS